VAIGGSAGSVAALERILPRLPASFPAVLVAVHVTPTAPSLLPALFAAKCAMRVQEVTAFEPILVGHVYFAPSDYHFLVEPDGRCALSIEPPVLFSRPAIDVLFESAAIAYGSSLAAVILTGASSDGARGLRRVREAGGASLVQHPSTAEADVMPRAAIDAAPDALVLPIDAIADHLLWLAAQSGRTTP
jgi:two-component system chemotaxis response regulator CheB